MNRDEWLTQLKTGDQAYQVSKYHDGTAKLVTVKVTPKQIRVGSCAYSKSGWHYSSTLVPPTEEALSEYKAMTEKKHLADNLRRLITSNLTDDQLRRIRAIVEEPTNA